MASHYSHITSEQAALIRSSRIFFVATADPALRDAPSGVGPINLSPKGGVPLHVLGPNRVAFLDYRGSGNETARHTLAGGSMALMVCSFDEANAAIVRLYGTARVSVAADSPLATLLAQQPAAELTSLRQVIEVDVRSTATSCGYGVPVMTFVRDRRAADRGRLYKEPVSSARSGNAAGPRA